MSWVKMLARLSGYKKKSEVKEVIPPASLVREIGSNRVSVNGIYFKSQEECEEVISRSNITMVVV